MATKSSSPKSRSSFIRTLRNEIKMAEALNESELKPQIREAIQRYRGEFIPEIESDWTVLINEIYPIIQFNLPAIFFRNPHVFLKPKQKTYIAKRRDPISGRMVDTTLDSTKSARTQEAIMNYLLPEIRYKDEVRKVLTDSLIFKHGILWHGYKGSFGMTEEDSLFIRQDQIFAKRWPITRFLKDPSVTLANLDEAKWIGRQFDVRLSDLLEDDKLNIDKKHLKGELGFGEQLRSTELDPASGTDHVTVKNLIDFTEDEFRKSADSRFVKVYEILHRPTKKEKREGKKGQVILLTFEQPDPLRENPWPYKAEGWPAKILEFNPVPDQHFGMSDIETYSAIADHANLVINQQIRNAEQTNRSLIGISKEGSNEEDVEKVLDGSNNAIGFETGNPRDRMFVANMGTNSSNELYLLDQRIRRRLEEVSGVSDLKKGHLQSGEESAASVKIRNAGSSSRPLYRQDIMADFLRESVTYMNQLVKQFFPVNRAVRIVGSTDIEWSDEFTKEEIQAEVDVDIDVISMVPPNPEQELREIGEVLRLMIDAVNNPAVMQKLGQENKTFNLAPVIDKFLERLRINNPEVFREIKPEESLGFVSVAELRAAQANVEASLQGAEPPSPPAEGQDHKARLSVYTSISALLQAMGQEAELLNQIIQLQAQLLQAEQDKENPQPNQPVRSGSPSSNGIQSSAIQTAGTR